MASLSRRGFLSGVAASLLAGTAPLNYSNAVLPAGPWKVQWGAHTIYRRIADIDATPAQEEAARDIFKLLAS